jgi:hypothetical protein
MSSQERWPGMPDMIGTVEVSHPLAVRCYCHVRVYSGFRISTVIEIGVDMKSTCKRVSEKGAVPVVYLKLPNGQAMIGQSHDYKRNGTTTLFAAFNVTSAAGA